MIYWFKVEVHSHTTGRLERQRGGGEEEGGCGGGFSQVRGGWK